jgi:hypothetical protein
MQFENALTPFDRIVFAVVLREIEEVDRRCG